jgi:hypothetical protein
MKLLLCAGALMLTSAVSAAAQTTPAPAPGVQSACASLPAQPTLPNGANADRAAMEAGNTAFTAWSQAYRAGLECRRAEAEELHARWRASVDAFNSAASAINSANQAWEAEVAEFNDRGGPPRDSRN